MLPHGNSQPIVYSFSSPSDLSTSLAAFIHKAQSDAINNEKKNRFTIAFSGGSLPTFLGELVGRPGIRWDKWQVYYADERLVPLNHPDSNHNLLQTTFLSKVPIPPQNVHTIDPKLIDDLLKSDDPDSAKKRDDTDSDDDDKMDPKEALADQYESQLIQSFAFKETARFPVFDLILLGMGPEGHTASLFPNHPLLSEEDRWVAWIDDAPKPPPRRITLTYPVINHAARVAFVATGDSKQDVLKTVLDNPEEGLPASRVRPRQPGQVYWFVDDAASAKVQYPKTDFKL